MILGIICFGWCYSFSNRTRHLLTYFLKCHNTQQLFSHFLHTNLQLCALRIFWVYWWLVGEWWCLAHNNLYYKTVNQYLQYTRKQFA